MFFRWFAAAAAILLLLFVVVQSGPLAQADSQFSVSSVVRQCNALPADFPEGLAGIPSCAETLGVNAVHNVTTIETVNAGSSALDRLVGFAPNGYTVATGGDIPDGEKVGGVRLAASFGLLNGPCTTPVNIDVALYDVALPNNLSAPRASTNIAYPRNQGQADRFGAWQIGSPPPDAGPPVGITDSGVDGRADPASLPIANYPSHLLDYFDPDRGGAAEPIVPKAVYGGLTFVQNEWIPIYIAVFPAGGLTSLPPPLSLMTTLMGQPFVYVIGDPTAATSSPSMITDICSPMSVTSMLLGQVGAVVRSRTAVTGGTYYWLLHAASRRDVDQDGIDNYSDTCPMAVNTGDTDLDGLDDACDPTPNAADSDPDGDTLQNRQDNCPQTANGGAQQVDSEVLGLTSGDGGPLGDGIGDACDSGGVSALQNGRTVNVTLSPAVANGRYHLRTDVAAKCIGAVDADGDGYCAAQDVFDVATATCPVACTLVRHRAWGATHPGQQMDTDGDRFSDAMETYVGTDATKSCAQDTTSMNEAPLDNWPLDLTDNTNVNYSDLSKPFGFPDALGQVVGQTVDARVRFDLNNDGFISTQDLTRYAQISDIGFGGGGESCAQLSIPPFSQQ